MLKYILMIFLPILSSCTGTEPICSLKPAAGRCRGYFTKFYYNPTSDDCFTFVYGGCQGNANRFNTYKDCINTCYSKDDGPFNTGSDKTCSLPAETGLCRAFIKKFYYNATKEDCLTFTYGGCGGNANSFDSYEECIQTCQPGEDDTTSCENDSDPMPSCPENQVPVNCTQDCQSQIYCPVSEEDSKSCNHRDECKSTDCKCGFNQRLVSPLNKTCISTRDCPAFSCNGPNEEYNSCPPYCPTDDCSQATESGKCPLLGVIGIVVECKPSCRCKKGYWRKNGICVPYAKCKAAPKPSCPENQVPVNGTQDCQSQYYCPISEEDSKSCKRNDKIKSTDCKCGFNQRFVSAQNKTCIGTRNCPAFSCNGPNEEYNSCPPYCPTDDCSQATESGKCPSLGVIGIVVECKPSCRCKKGYWRKNGICVPYAKCKAAPKPSCPENQVPVNGTQDCQSQYYCPVSEEDSKSCKRKDKIKSTDCKCGFNQRFVSAQNKTCIGTRDCPAFCCNDPNEEYDSCPPSCPTDDCSQATESGKCPFPGRIGIVEECKPTCRCRKGYWRKNGICVPYSECNCNP